MTANYQTISQDERKFRLATAVQQEVASGGRVQSQTEYNAVIVFGKPVNHVLHLISIFTLGLWVFVWGALIVLGGEKRRMVTVDDYGNVGVSNL